jgi:hypothetical protein
MKSKIRGGFDFIRLVVYLLFIYIFVILIRMLWLHHRFNRSITQDKYYEEELNGTDIENG